MPAKPPITKACRLGLSRRTLMAGASAAAGLATVPAGALTATPPTPQPEKNAPRLHDAHDDAAQAALYVDMALQMHRAHRLLIDLVTYEVGRIGIADLTADAALLLFDMEAGPGWIPHGPVDSTPAGRRKASQLALIELGLARTDRKRRGNGQITISPAGREAAAALRGAIGRHGPLMPFFGPSPEKAAEMIATLTTLHRNWRDTVIYRL